MTEKIIIDKDSAIPIYKQLINWMTGNIVMGDWPAGYRLAGEIDLARDLGVSRGSLRKAINLLVSRDLLTQVQGRGTFVNSSVIEQPLASNLVGVSEELSNAGTPFTTRVLQSSVIKAPEKVAQMLDVDPGTEVFVLKRVRSVGGDPVVLSESYLPCARFKKLVDIDFEKERLFSTLEKVYGVHLSWASRSIAAIRAEPEEAEYLNIEVNSPLLYNEQIVYDENNEKVEFSKGWFPGDRFRIRAIVQRQPKGGAESIGLPRT